MNPVEVEEAEDAVDELVTDPVLEREVVLECVDELWLDVLE